MQSLLTRKPIKTNTVSVYDRPNNDVYRAQLGTERSKSIISESSVSAAQVCQKIYQSERRSQRKTNESARLGKSQSACIGLAVVSEPDLTKALVCDVTAAMARRHRSKAAKITQM